MNGANASRVLAIVLTATALLSQSSFAFSWILYGNVVNATSCSPIIGANVSSPYNNYAFNISNKVGNYSLALGIGNWSVTVSAVGYSNGSYLTPYLSSGALDHNFALVPIGGTPRSVPCGMNTTVINSTATTITPGVQNTTVAPTTVVTNTTTTAYSSTSNDYIIGGVIVLIIIIAAIAYFATRKKPEHHHQKAE